MSEQRPRSSAERTHIQNVAAAMMARRCEESIILMQTFKRDCIQDVPWLYLADQGLVNDAIEACIAQEMLDYELAVNRVRQYRASNASNVKAPVI